MSSWPSALIGTNRIVGRDVASAIASASIVVLVRFDIGPDVFGSEDAKAQRFLVIRGKRRLTVDRFPTILLGREKYLKL